MSDELLSDIGNELQKRANAAREQARLNGVDFRPVGSADGIRVGDIVSVRSATSRYKVTRIDPELSDLFDATSEVVYFAGLKGLTGPFKGRSRRLTTRLLRSVS